MLVDLLHNFGDGVGRPPCGRVAMTLVLPALAAGREVRVMDVRWPDFSKGDMVVCGSCQGYAGECLNDDCSRAHTCVPVQRPDGRWICRAGCDGGKG